MSNASSLAHPVPGITNYQLVTDSSQYCVGAALHQMVNNKPIPIGFFSRKLSETQKRYSTFDRELLAAFLAVLHFKHYIDGHHVSLFTDHRPLVSAFVSQKPAKSDKQQRYLSLLTEYLADVQFIRGDNNIVADCLSRPAMAVSIDPCDLPALAYQQKEDNELQEYKEKLTSFPLKDNVELWCDTSLPYPRPFVPMSSRASVFNSLHGISHPGIKTSLKLLKSRYFWPDIDKNVRQWCRDCQACQQAKVTRHTRSPVHQFQLPSERFQTVHLDIVGPLPPVKRHGEQFFAPQRYLLTCIDRSTKWIEAAPISEITASAVASTFLSIWISRFGVPLHVITDRGTQFEAELFSQLSTLIGFNRLRTCAYHPQCNGMIERVHRTIKTAITARKQNWLDSLPVVLMGIRSVCNDSGYSPFMSVTGSAMLLPQPIITQKKDSYFDNTDIKTLAEEMHKLDLSKLSSDNKISRKFFVPPALKDCTRVWLRVDRVRRPLEAPYSGPYLVKKRFEKYFVIELLNGKEESVSIDRLKPAFSPAEKLPNSSQLPAREIPETEPIEKKEPPVQVGNSTAEKISRSGRRITFSRNNDYVYY